MRRKEIKFSNTLRSGIRKEIEITIMEVGEIEGIEETVGDNLVGSDSKEFDKLIEEFGFEEICKAIRREFHL